MDWQKICPASKLTGQQAKYLIVTFSPVHLVTGGFISSQ